MPPRQRGVVLTDRGLERLESAIATAQDEEKFGKRFTQTELKERTEFELGKGLSIKTVKKIRKRTAPVDEASVQNLFEAFYLELEAADYGHPDPSSDESETLSANAPRSSAAKIDWGEKPDTGIFFGRTEELATLGQWVMAEQCRVVTLLGMGGIGKTSLAAKLADQVYEQFDYVIWRSLREAPPLDEILVRLIQFLSDQQETEINLPRRLGERIIRLLHYLREYRCLLLLDNLESILQPESAGHFRDGYADYGELIHRIGEAEHQSCLLLTSRECPRELAALAGDRLPVRLLSITGIDPDAGREILKAKGLELDEADTQGQELIDRYGGNPQALHLVATAIQREFLGDVDDFLEEEGAVVEDVWSLLDQHLARLSALEHSIFFWLAINRKPVGLDELMEDLLPPVTKREVRSALRGLSDRYLIEKVNKQFTLQNVIMEFATERFIEEILRDLSIQKFNLFHTHALIKTKTEDYVRETQVRLILRPVIACTKNLNEIFINSLEYIHENFSQKNSYAPGNLLNLFVLLSDIEISELDFSKLFIRNAVFTYRYLHAIDFSYSTFKEAKFIHSMGTLLDVAFSPVSKELAISDGRGDIYIYELSDKRLKALLSGHMSWVRSIAFSPNGYTLASGSADKTVRLWDLKAYKCLLTLSKHDGMVWAVAFHPSGHLLASGDANGKIAIWDRTSGKCLRFFESHLNKNTKEEVDCSDIWSLSFSYDGEFLVSSHYSSYINVWEVKTWECRHQICLNKIPVRTACFAPQKNYRILIGNDNGRIYCWDIPENDLKIIDDEIESEVWSLVFTQDSLLFASAHTNGMIRVWNSNSMVCEHIISTHASRVWSLSFDNDTHCLASLSEDSTVKIWDLNDYSCLHTFRGYSEGIWELCLFPSDSENKDLCATSHENGSVCIWNLRESKLVNSIHNHYGRVWSLSFDPNNGLLASGGEDKKICIFSVRSHQLIRELRGHSDRVLSTDFSRDGSLLVSGSSDGTFRIWNVEDGECLHVEQSHEKWIHSVKFSPDNKFIASASQEGNIRVFKITEARILFSLNKHPNSVNSLEFSACGNYLFSGGDDSIVRLWDMCSRKCISAFEGHTHRINSLALSLCGKWVACGGDDAKVSVWNINCPDTRKVLLGHDCEVRFVKFSLDSKNLFSTSLDGTTRIWDLQTGKCQSILRRNRPYERVKLNKVRGLTDLERASLLSLGAIDETCIE